jgi:nickel transport protein
MYIKPKKWQMVFFCLAFLLAAGLASAAYAHGVTINYTISETGQVKLDAAFDTGEPMGEAQVTIYAPDDPAKPWLTGVADENGHFEFTVDPSKPGTWDIQFRKAGHGEMIHITVEQVAVDVEVPSSAGPEATAEPAAETETESQPAEPAVEAASGEAETPVEVEPVSAVAETPASAAEPVSADTAGPETNQPTEGETAKQQVVVVSSSSSGSTGFTTFQILLMSGSVIWGFIGTALYFARRSS